MTCSHRISTYLSKKKRTGGGWGKAHLTLHVRNTINHTPDQIIQCRIGPLIQQNGPKRRRRIHKQPELHRSVDGPAGDKFQRPLVGEDEEAQRQVDRLQIRIGFHGQVEVLGVKVEKDLGPEVGVDRGCDVVCEARVC